MYKTFKNYLHNKMDISKDEIREMVEMAVERIVERKLDVMFHDKYTMERYIDNAISERGMNYWLGDETTVDDYIKDRVVRELLKGVRLNVEIEKAREEINKKHKDTFND